MGEKCYEITRVLESFLLHADLMDYVRFFTSNAFTIY